MPAGLCVRRHHRRAGLIRLDARTVRGGHNQCARMALYWATRWRMLRRSGLRRCAPPQYAACPRPRTPSAGKMPKTRIVLADDHPVVLAGIRMLINAAPELEVVGESQAGDEALDLILALKPDIAILDISLPVLNGIAVARQAAGQLPHLGAIILTSLEGRLYLHQ